jgi:hypothetical protein
MCSKLDLAVSEEDYTAAARCAPNAHTLVEDAQPALGRGWNKVNSRLMYQLNRQGGIFVSKLSRKYTTLVTKAAEYIVVLVTYNSRYLDDPLYH